MGGNWDRAKYSNSSYPIEAFTHELLHINIQVKGYKKIKYGISSYDNYGYLKYFLETLDNEMQHNKIYKTFNDLGFEPTKFYNDQDEHETKKHIDDYLLHPNKNQLMIMTQYMTILSPGAEFLFEDIEVYKKKFRKIREGSNPKILDLLYNKMAEWRKQSDFNYEGILSNIFQRVPKAGYTFFGFTDSINLPEYGFFTAFPFNIKQNGTTYDIIPI